MKKRDMYISFLSTELDIDNYTLESLGAINPVMDEDGNHFVNLERLCVAQVSEFSGSYRNNSLN